FLSKHIKNFYRGIPQHFAGGNGEFAGGRIGINGNKFLFSDIINSYKARCAEHSIATIRIADQYRITSGICPYIKRICSTWNDTAVIKPLISHVINVRNDMKSVA